MAGDFAEIVRPHLEAQLESAETLKGILVATQQKTFSGKTYVVGVTERRLFLQPVDRRMQPDGPARIVTPETLDEAAAGGAGGGWWSAGSAILDATAIKVELKTTDGEKLKLMMMRGTGLLGGLGGGEAQREGVEALAEWFRRRAGS